MKADESTGKGVETATGRVKITALDPTQQIVLSLEATADRDKVYKIPGAVRFTVTVNNDSTVEVKNIAVKAVDVELYRFESIPAGGTASFIRDVEISEPGTFQFVATCKDQLDQTQTFSSNQIQIAHVDPTPVVTDTPLATPLAPSVAPMPTDQPEPEWLDQAESIAEGIKWILTGIAAVLLVLLLIGAIRRGRSRSESKKAMDHLEGGTYRDYSAVPKRRRRSEISNGGTEAAEVSAEEEKPEETEGTAQNSELMAETLRKLYSEKPEESVPEVVTEAADAAEEVSAKIEEAAAEAGNAAEEAEQEAKGDAEEAGGSRRRRGRKQE